MSKILVVEADRNLTQALEAALIGEGFEVVVAHNGVEALRAVQSEKPDEVILDPMLAWVGGTRVRETPRPGSKTSGEPMIVLNLKTNESRRVLPLPRYAKPESSTTEFFDINELLASVKALEHRSAATAPTGILRAGLVEMDMDGWLVAVSGRPVTLTAKEFGLLRMLLKAKGRVLTRDVLQEAVWEEKKVYAFDSRKVDVHMGRLRRKLGAAGSYIMTVRGVGYRFAAIPETPDPRMTTEWHE